MGQQYRRQQQQEQSESQMQTFWPMLDYNQHVMMALQACIITPPIFRRGAIRLLQALVLEDWKDDQYRRDIAPVVVNGHMNNQGMLVLGYEEEAEYNVYDPILIDYGTPVLHAIAELLHRRGVFDTSDSVSLIP